MKLEYPELKHKEAYETMIKEWSEYEQIPTSPSKLFVGNSYGEFLEIINKDTINNENGVNSTLFFLLNEENNILGAIHIRYHINHPVLSTIGGHIGYGVAPKYRKQGYASKMLELGLIEARKLGIEKVLITCLIDNIASNKVIQKNLGIFESEIESEYGKFNRYWVSTKI